MFLAIPTSCDIRCGVERHLGVEDALYGEIISHRMLKIHYGGSLGNLRVPMKIYAGISDALILLCFIISIILVD